MTEWIKEFNIKLICDLKNLDFYCNSKGHVIEVHLNDNNCNVRLFSSNYRLSFSNDRLFDFNNLDVKKGNDARNELVNLLSPLKNDILEELETTKLRYDIPTSVTEDFVNMFNGDAIDLRKILDFNVNYLEYDLGRDFVKNDPKFATEKRLKLALGIQNKYIKTINWIDSKKIDILFSTDNESWTENLNETKNLITNFHTLDRKYTDIKKYLENLINSL
ncbi:hypothetical protein [Acidianus manzaensis]|uniref:Uncharacterized protein n=1 Tax=Acidianus manzaensis TaxID=282676 RepID=A0A1W6JXH1_9CREN|nr:hypothetical protein [Acidianus manzaensis]ARM74963.1 hypothetical protein B6F84_02240 [Acidianus manzaensis]